MKFFLKKYKALPFLLALFFVTISSFTFVHAQSSIADVCGQTATSPKCGVGDIAKITKGLLTLVIGLGLPLLVVFITYRFVTAWFALQQGNANAYKEALTKSWNATLGFFFIVALFGGLMFVILKYLGVKNNNEFNPLKLLESFSLLLVPHAYAAETGYLPNPVGVNSLYDFILSIIRLIMRFFIYPALIVIWVWTGFGFVMAQGNPEGLNKAKKWLMWAFATTFLIFLLQTFLIAAQGTVNKILPGTGASTQITTGTPDGRVAPKVGEVRSSCTTTDGSYGIITTTGECVVGGTR